MTFTLFSVFCIKKKKNLCCFLFPVPHVGSLKLPLCPDKSKAINGFVVKSCLTLEAPWPVARQAPLSTGFPRQRYWSGLPVPSPGDLPDPEIKP